MILKLGAIFFLLIFSTYANGTERNLLFVVGKNPGKMLYDIYSANPQNLEYKKIIPDGLIPTWSPDGEKIAFLHRGLRAEKQSAFTTAYCIAARAGNEIKKITTKHFSRQAFDINWSPDMRKLAWALDQWVLISSMDEEEFAYKGKNQIFQVEWTKDSNQVVFLDTGGGIFLLDLRSKEARCLSENGVFPKILPGTNKMVFLMQGVVKETADMFLQDLGKSTEEVLLKDIATPFPKKSIYSISGDGKKIFFYSGQNCNQQPCDLGVYDVVKKNIQTYKKWDGMIEAVSFDGTKIAGLFGSGKQFGYGIHDLKSGKRSLIRELQQNELGRQMTIMLRHMDW